MSLRVLARMLSYPDAALREHLPEMKEILNHEAALSDCLQDKMDELISALMTEDEIDLQAAYVELFDRGRKTSLHLFEHVHGDSRDRGPAMIDLAQTYEKAGLFLKPDELPDYLPALLEFASTLSPEEARAFLGEMAHIFTVIYQALTQRGSAYAGILAALIELSGEQPVQSARDELRDIVPDESLDDMDEIWVEPVAFDGCTMPTPNRHVIQPIIRQDVHFTGVSK
jgi:nitrate reductase delta subunit